MNVRSCTLGVGCDEAGICYAAAHGRPEECPIGAAMNALKACARELLAAELGWKSEAACLEWIDAVEREVLNRAGSAIPMSAALRAIEKALTRSPVCEDAGEVVEALRYAREQFVEEENPDSLGDVLARIDAALAKSLPSPRGWQPIETAPKDTWVLVYMPNEDDCMGRIHVAKNCTIANGTLWIIGHRFISDLSPPTCWTSLPLSAGAQAMILPRIERYLRATKRSPSRFGREAMGDPNFVTAVRNGRRLRQSTIDKVNAWLDTKEITNAD